MISTQADPNIITFTARERALFPAVDLDYLQQITFSQLDAFGIRISDYNMKNLIIHFALMICRIRTENYMTPMNIQTDSVIMSVVDQLCEEMEEHYNITVSKGEKVYIYLHLISNTHMDAMKIDDTWLSSSIQAVLEIIYKNYHFDLREDSILIEDLFRHMKSIFTSKSFGLETRNPLLNTIKNNYPLAFEISLTALSKIFTNSPYTLTEEDIGYISVHIGAAIERYYASHTSKKNVLLLCSSGQATARMLETRLKLFFPDKINIMGICSYNEYCNYTEDDTKNIDFVISTIPLEYHLLPSIVVDFSLKNKDIESISRFLNQIGMKDRRTDFFDASLFFKIEKKIAKDELLQMMCERLQKQDVVEEDFFSLVLEREKLGNTNMSDVFALAHPMKVCAKKTKVAVALLSEPVSWNEEESVQIVFLLAISPGVQKDIEHLYDTFIDIVNDSKLQQKIVHANTFSEFISILEN